MALRAKSKMRYATMDGNEAAASVAYRTNEICAIYPITPSSNMGEFADEWASKNEPNAWGTVPDVVEMQSEGGASGAVHGALQSGSLTTTFTASQGLLLMIPNMYKIAGELTSTVFHVAARSLATSSLSIFGDHSDVMATRQTGYALIASSSVQEAHDLALVAQAATLGSRVPFVHFFDGFRTSHEVSKITMISDEEIRKVIDDDLIFAHRHRALSPDRPFIRGTAQNPDVYFQAREAVNPFYAEAPGHVERAMARFAEATGRKYRLFDYFGHAEPERVIILMGSGVETARELTEYLVGKGERVGIVQVHLYRPFSAAHLRAALPRSVKSIAVLDRTKEPGSAGEPLYVDVVTALSESVAGGSWPAMPRIIGGRYGLSSKEFTPAMVKAVFDELAKKAPKNHFTVGIDDDVSHTSLAFDPSFVTESKKSVRAVFHGLGADGTVSANKNSIKIIGEETDNYAQGYFVYDSKKSGTRTVSHLRFGPEPIRSTYLVQSATFVACSQVVFLDKVDILENVEKGGTVLLNTPHGPDEVWDSLPRPMQQAMLDKGLKLFVINADKVARELGLGGRTNTIMQTCFFALSGVLPRDEAIAKIKSAIEKTYSGKGLQVVKKNFEAVDRALDNLHEVKVPKKVTSTRELLPPVSADAPKFVKDVLGPMIVGKGDALPVSVIPADGTYPSGSTAFEKRNIAPFVPIWDEELCIQCGHCVFICPHASLRAKTYDAELAKGAPAGFRSVPLRGKGTEGKAYTLQVFPEDCTGCTLCVEICPVKSKEAVGKKALNMVDKDQVLEVERATAAFFDKLPETKSEDVDPTNAKSVQYLEPMFEFSGACTGCGETPYVRLASQLFGDRMMVANATGCSSIYGGNLPTTPWSTNADGRGPAWSNSLFEDNAEFGLGMRLTADRQHQFAVELLKDLSGQLGDELVKGLVEAPHSSAADIAAQRRRVAELRSKLEGIRDPKARHLASVAEFLVRRSVWIMGGDGWAYDIGYGGLDHVLASGRDVNVLVLDTEVYSNTGGQASKATPTGAVAKFAAAGRPSAKKDLGLMAMAYGNVYVARVAMGASIVQTLNAFREAEAYPGPSLIIAYSHCIAHGYDLAGALGQQKLAVQSGHWPLFRYNPAHAEAGKNPFTLDSTEPKTALGDYIYKEARYEVLKRKDPDRAKMLLARGEAEVKRRWKLYSELASGSAFAMPAVVRSEEK